MTDVNEGIVIGQRLVWFSLAMPRLASIRFSSDVGVRTRVRDG